MRRWGCVLGALVWMAAGCGSGSSGACTFNSDCPTGRYCTAAHVCTADCASDGECVRRVGPGASCSSFGMCLAPPDAGPSIDASVPDAGPGDDAGRDAAAPTDAGHDAGPPPEVCTQSTTGSVPVDEDLDLAIDEGCGWHFGQLHPVPTLPGPAAGAYVSGTQPSADGLSLLVTLAAGPAVVSRATRADPYGPPTPIPVMLGSVASNVSVAILDATGLEMWAQLGTPTGQHLASAHRTSTSASFDPFVLAAMLNSTSNDYHPALRADGLELVFGSARSGAALLYHATRASTSEPFGTPTPLSVEAPTPLADRACPALSQDGLTLFFATHGASSWRVYTAHRTSIDATSFDPAVEIAELNLGGEAFFVSISESTREIFVVSNRAWAPGSGGSSVWRAEICRDGPCADRFVPCDTGMRSPDGLHCYFPGPSPMGDESAMRLGCASLGGHPPTATSEAERAFLWSHWGGAASYVWLGATDRDHEGSWRWDWTGRVGPEEPWVFAPWGAGNPDNYRGVDPAGENYLQLNGPLGGAFNDVYAAFVSAYVCESELWPTW